MVEPQRSGVERGMSNAQMSNIFKKVSLIYMYVNKLLSFFAGPPSAVRSKSDCKSRGPWFEPWSGHILSRRFIGK